MRGERRFCGDRRCGKAAGKLAGTSYGKRIHFLGYCMDLPGTYRALHLYLNPRRLGGGWSSAMALMAGLPVVTLPACDVAYNVGGEFTVTTEEEMVDAVIRYASDTCFTRRRSRLQSKKAGTAESRRCSNMSHPCLQEYRRMWND